MRTTLKLCVILGCILGTANIAMAHPGGMAKDGCHKDSETGLRHAHVTIPDGVYEVTCNVWKAILLQPEADVLRIMVERDQHKVRAEAAEAERNRARADFESVEIRYDALLITGEQDRYRARAVLDNALTVLSDAEIQAEEILDEALVVMHQAEERERGAGPPASRDCRRALRFFVFDKDTGWFNDIVKVDESERDLLKRACHGP